MADRGGEEVPAVVRHHYPDAVPFDDAVLWSQWSLARIGFHPSTVLPVVALCRDELMLRAEQAISSTWGPAFNAGSLAGMLFLGRTGIAAALGHAPGEDGRHRFVVFCLPHIGISDSGELGRTRRAGMYRDSSACGALLELHRQLAAGTVDSALDDSDLEQSLVRRRLAPASAATTLRELTESARAAAVSDVTALIGGLGTEHPVDVAVMSGVVVHGPQELDYLGSADAFVIIDGERTTLMH